MRSGPALQTLLVALAALISVLGRDAHAGGINHFEAAAGPHNYIVTNHPSVLPHLTPSAWLLTSYAHDPLVFRDASGREVQKIVEHQANFEVAAALGLFDRFELGLVAPALFVNGPGFTGNGLTQFSPGDLRVLGKVLLTPWNTGVVASFRVQSALVPLPQLIQGGSGAIAGEKYPNVQPALSVGFNSQYVRVGLDAGFLLRAPTAISSLDVGSAFTYGGGLEVSVLPQTLFITGDVYGRWSPTFLGTSNNQVPLEAATAVKLFLGPALVMLGVGTGIIADYGSPDFRVFGAVGFYPQDKDRDDDGILDADDACPDEPEDKDGYEDADGCPEPDNDNDGILDVDDKCPLEPEDIDRWEDKDGCPEDDNDGDGISDDADECPNDPEVKNGFEDEDGCPDEADKKKLVVVKREKIEINDKIYFAYDSDRILPRSYELLDQVGTVINDHPEIPAIFIEGHTDADGSDVYNLDLSDRRARSVRRYLVENASVAPERLKAEGFGEQKPVASNATEEGKAQNRRVEFKIVDIDGGTTSEELDVPATNNKTKKTRKTKSDDNVSDEDMPDGEDAERAGSSRVDPNEVLP